LLLGKVNPFGIYFTSNKLCVNNVNILNYHNIKFVEINIRWWQKFNRPSKNETKQSEWITIILSRKWSFLNHVNICLEFRSLVLILKIKRLALFLENFFFKYILFWIKSIRVACIFCTQGFHFLFFQRSNICLDLFVLLKIPKNFYS